jgi:hypothetical protein
MITQTIKQGENVIRIENAENLEDAQKHGFKNGEYSRYFINDKLVSSYMVLVKYIIEETKKNKESFIPDKNNLKKIKKEMFEKQTTDMKTQLLKVKEHYTNFNLPESFFKNIDSMIEKIDDSGIRVIK